MCMSIVTLAAFVWILYRFAYVPTVEASRGGSRRRGGQTADVPAAGQSAQAVAALRWRRATAAGGAAAARAGAAARRRASNGKRPPARMPGGLLALRGLTND